MFQKPATRDDVNLAYRILLGRDADPGGLEHHYALAQRTGADISRVAELLIRSEEFAARHGGLAVPVEVQMNGRSLYVRTSDRDIGRLIAAGKDYEPHVTALVTGELKEGDTFLDVGANIGYFTMLGAQCVGPRGRVIAVEPLDKNLQLLYRSLARNHFENVEVFPFGVSDAVRRVSMVTDPDTSNALVLRDGSGTHGSSFATTCTLDWITRDTDRIDFMKIDIEGHELFAWRGAAAMLARCRPRIVTEFHPLAMRQNSSVDSADYLKLLFDYGGSVNVVSHQEEEASCATVDEVMLHWARSDARCGGKGSSHLDLFVTPRD